MGAGGGEVVTAEGADVSVGDEEIRQERLDLSPRPPIVLLVGDPQPPTMLEALRSGARAVLWRDSSPDQIIAAIEAVKAGLVVIHPEDLDPWLGHSRPIEITEPLSSRETEMLGMIP